MDGENRNILLFFAVVILLHLPTGLYAFVDDGTLIFGLTAPERFLIHYLTGDTSHITVSGAQKHIINDICVMECVNCPLNCYHPPTLHVDCAGGCTLQTQAGKVIANQDQKFYSLYQNALMRDQVTFRCYDDECGFDQLSENGKTYSVTLPESIKVDR